MSLTTQDNSTVRNQSRTNFFTGEVCRSQEQSVDFEMLMAEWRGETTTKQLIDYAESLGVDAIAVRELGAAYAKEYRAWAWPMYGQDAAVIGIRLRSESRKWAVTGSKSGAFMAFGCTERTVYLPEGPTDTSALFSMGLYAIGRPMAIGCESVIVDILQRQKIKRAVIVADGDDAGRNGALRLQKELRIPSVIYLPPCKDARELLRLGGDRQMIENTVNQTVWTCPTPSPDSRQEGRR